MEDVPCPSCCSRWESIDNYSDSEVSMNTYKWTCTACETPNLLVHDPDEKGHMALSCKQCGAAGQFETESQTVKLHYPPGEPFPTGLMSTCSTTVAPDTQLMLGLERVERLAKMSAPFPYSPTKEDREDERQRNKHTRLALGVMNNAKKRRWPWQTGR